MSEKMSSGDIAISAEEYDKISHIQQLVLEKVALDEPVHTTLNALCVLAESLLPNAVSSIMIMDESTGLMSVLCAPSIPEVGHKALANLQPGPCGGSCGNAVFHNEPQFVQNTFEDPRWENIRQIAYDFNLCSCWSMPIRNQNKKAIGSFALSSFEHRTPNPFHRKLLEISASIVSIILKKEMNERRLQLFSAAIQNSTEGMVITDKNNHILEVNAAFEHIYGYQESEVVGKNPSFFSSGKQDAHFYQNMWNEIIQHDKWSGEIINQRADGELISQWMSISVIKNEKKEIQNYLSIFSDLTELKNVQNQIVEMAFYDSTTRLHNKTYLEQQLLDPSKKYILILLNINNFSYINTSYGFDTGDQLLVKIARLLTDNFNAHSTYRLNSDEFALLFEHNDLNKDINIVQKIKQIQRFFYNTLITINEVSLNISFTYGAAFGNKKLLRSCALALKQAKELGKNRYHVFDHNEESIDHSARKMFISANNMLHSALEEDRVIPFFQGIYDNNSHKITKYEVLVRIEDGGKIISPYHFLEPARLSGLLPKITKVIIDKSFQVMSTTDAVFSINITEDDLSKCYLVDYLEEKSQQYNIAPQRVILEILEGVSSTGKKNHIIQLNELKSKGYALAIDDFGAEYSNFERILDLDIDFLKIDAKYIKDIDVNKKSFEITRAIAYFAKNANIPCIAEFVHKESVQNVVAKLGIDYSQGYYFSEPAASLIQTK